MTEEMKRAYEEAKEILRKSLAENCTGIFLTSPDLIRGLLAEIDRFEGLLKAASEEAVRWHIRIDKAERDVAFWQEKARRAESDKDADLERRKQIRLDRILSLMPRVEVGFPPNSQAQEAAQRLAAAEHVVEIWAARGDK